MGLQLQEFDYTPAEYQTSYPEMRQEYDPSVAGAMQRWQQGTGSGYEVAGGMGANLLGYLLNKYKKNSKEQDTTGLPNPGDKDFIGPVNQVNEQQIEDGTQSNPRSGSGGHSDASRALGGLLGNAIKARIGSRYKPAPETVPEVMQADDPAPRGLSSDVESLRSKVPKETYNSRIAYENERMGAVLDEYAKNNRQGQQDVGNSFLNYVDSPYANSMGTSKSYSGTEAWGKSKVGPGALDGNISSELQYYSPYFSWPRSSSSLRNELPTTKTDFVDEYLNPPVLVNPMKHVPAYPAPVDSSYDAASDFIGPHKQNQMQRDLSNPMLRVMSGLPPRMMMQEQVPYLGAPNY